MDRLAQRTDSNVYSHSQTDLMNGVSIQNRSSTHIPSNMSSRTSFLPRPKGEEWKSSSSMDSGWKTTSNGTKKMESWKMSGKPRHAQLAHIQHQEEDPRLRRQSAPLFNSPSWNPKPLPIEPTPIIQHGQIVEDPHYTTAPFHITTPMQPPAFIRPQPSDFYPQVYNNSPPYPPTEYPPTTQDFTQPYPPPQQPAGYAAYPPFIHNNSYPPQHPQPYQDPVYQHPNPESVYQHPNPEPVYQHPNPEYPPEPTQAVSLQDPPVPKPEKATKKKDPSAKPEKKVRQITVQSINAEHRVWIDVLPAETGLSLAEKIHIIATFRTRKIVSIQTASGRKVPLDNRPVFGSWMDMESFEDGERWTVEWRENDRGVMDKFMSKIVQAGGGKRKDHIAKE